MENHIDLVPLLRSVQEYISFRYAAALTNTDKRSQLKAYIEKYLNDTQYTVGDMTREELIDRLYSEMAEYSILTPYLGAEGVEEINVNSWDDIAVTYTS